MQQLYLRQLFLYSCMSLLCSFLCLPLASANNPCTAYVYEFNNGVQDTVPCGNAANTVPQIDIDAAGPTDFQLSENCAPVLAAPNDYVAWFTFIIPSGGSTFEWQIIETGRDDVNYEIYYSNDAGGANECTDLTYYHCGNGFVSWELLGVPDPSRATRYYVAIYTEKADDDVDVNLKFRKACGESCRNADIAVVAAEDRCIDAGGSTILAASPSGGGGANYTYLWSPNDGTIDNIHSPIPTVNPSVTTTYTVQVRGEDGCPAFDEVTVQVGDCCLSPPEIECAPRFVGCPGLSTDPYVTGTPEIIESAETCSDVKFSYSDQVIRVDASCPGAQKIRRTWTATYYDFPDLETTCEQIILLKDDNAPRIRFNDERLQAMESGDTIRVECDPQMPFGLESAIVTDNCDEYPIVEFDDFVTQTGDCVEDRFNWIMDCRWRATDKCGNSSDFQIIVIIEDTTPPQAIFTPADVTTNCGSIPAVETPEFTDNCSADITIELSETNTADECEGSYSILRTWTATDVCHNVATITQTITVVDDVAPVLSNIPYAQTVSCEEIPSVPTNIAAYDNCDENVQIAFSETIQDGDCAGDYQIIRTWTATDACGNQSVDNQTIKVEDNTPPSLFNIPENTTSTCDKVLPAATNISATDNCDDEVNITFSESEQAGDCMGNYVITRVWKATDDCGNATTARQTISVKDNTAPILQNVPTNVSAECTDLPAIPNVTATDNCTVNVNVLFSEDIPNDADCASGYVITRTWTAIDDCGNQTVATQEIKVQDNTAPEFWDVPTDVNAECGEIPAVPNVTATDNCDENVNIVFNENVPTNADCASGYVIVRTWKATDNCGNQTVATQEIKVQDNTAPEFWDVPSDVNAECGDIPAVPNVTATDNCDENVNIVFNENIPTNADCASGYVIVRTWKATDNCGNQTVAKQEIKVQDNTAPEFWDIPTDVNAECGDIPTAPNVTATDNCDENVDIIFNENIPTNADCANGYVIVRTWKATDNCGNQTVATQEIKVQDNTAP
ncbi:MAG: PKD domain-containing protein, partial [Saprospiraceae bacterium]